MIDLWFLDQSGFCPTLPTGYGWGRLGRRLVVRHEEPQSRRVKFVGALAPYRPAGPRLLRDSHCRKASTDTTFCAGRTTEPAKDLDAPAPPCALDIPTLRGESEAQRSAAKILRYAQ